MLKVVSLFLIGMVVLAMFGRLRLPGGMRDLAERLRQRRKGSGLPKPATCRRCGKMNLRGGACPDCDGRQDD
jgi:hypothetical protein